VVGISLGVLVSAVVAAALNWRFGGLPNVVATLIGVVWLLSLRRIHPPRPERVRAVAPVASAPQKPRNPTIEMAEALVNERRYDQAAKLLQGCVADECTVILMRIAHELHEND
jgi:hypothetical protein